MLFHYQILEGYLIASCVKESTHKIKKKTQKKNAKKNSPAEISEAIRSRHEALQSRKWRIIKQRRKKENVHKRAAGHGWTILLDSWYAVPLLHDTGLVMMKVLPRFLSSPHTHTHTFSPIFCSLKGPRPPSHGFNRHSRKHTPQMMKLG